MDKSKVLESRSWSQGQLFGTNRRQIHVQYESQTAIIWKFGNEKY